MSSSEDENDSSSSRRRSWKSERRPSDYFQTPDRSNREFLEGEANDSDDSMTERNEKRKPLPAKRLFEDKNELSSGVNGPKGRRLSSGQEVKLDLIPQHYLIMLVKKIRRLVKNRPSSRFNKKKYHTVKLDLIPQHYLIMLVKKIRRLVKNRPSSRFNKKKYHTVKLDVIPQHYLIMLVKKIRRLVKNRPLSRFNKKKYHTVVMGLVPQLDKKIRLVKNRPSLSPFKNEKNNTVVDKKRSLVKNTPSLSRLKNKSNHTVVQLFIPQHDLTILDKKLRRLLRNIASLYGSKNGHSSSAGPICLAAFKKTCIMQGKNLISLHYWETAVEYVQMAWSHVESIPNCDNHALHKTKQACLKSLALLCKKALTMMIRNGLTKKKSKDLLMWMEDAGKQSTAIQPCADILKEFHSKSG